MRLDSWRAALAAFGVLAGVLLAPPAHAQDARTMRIVVPAPPGGNLDTTARLVANWMAAQSGEPWVVENRPGANAMIGTELVVRAPADGRTVLYHATGIVITPQLQKFAFSPLDELAPVVQASVERYALVVPAASPIDSVRALEQQAATTPQGLNCAAAPGVSTMGCEQFRDRVRGRSTIIPYVGVAPAVQALLGGHADLLFVNFESVARLVETGRLRELAVSSRQNLKPPHSSMPLMADAWPGFVTEGFSGFFVPAATPAARVQELNRDFNRALSDPVVRATMQESGQDPVGGSAERFAATLRRAHQRYGEVIQRMDSSPR